MSSSVDIFGGEMEFCRRLDEEEGFVVALSDVDGVDVRIGILSTDVLDSGDRELFCNKEYINSMVLN